MIVDTTEFRKGLRILQDGEPFTIVEFQHVKRARAAPSSGPG
jgi:elongation factor P